MKTLHRRPRLGVGLTLVVIAGLGVIAWRGGVTIKALRMERARLATELISRSSLIESAKMSQVAIRESDQHRPSRESNAAAFSKEAIELEMRRKLAELQAGQAARPRDPARPAPPNGPYGNVTFPELVGDPVYAEAVRNFMRPSVEKRYAPFIEQLTVAPAVKAQFAELLFAHSLVELDILDLMERQGIDPADKGKLREIKLEIEQSSQERMRKVLGDAAYSEFERFTMTFLGREEAVGPFVRRLSYSDYPLTRRQEERLIELFANAVDPKTGRKILVHRFTRELVARAESVLSPRQIVALRKFAEIEDAGPTSSSPAPAAAAR